MKRSNRVVMMLGAALALSGIGVQAHHSTAGYDSDKMVTVSGVVKKFHWTNPHIFIYLLVPDDKGDTVEWSLEGGTPNINIRNGWKSDDIKPGDKITVQFHPARDGKPDGQAAIITLSDGQTRYSPGFETGQRRGPGGPPGP